VKLNGTRSVQLMRLGIEYRVNPNSALFGDLKVLLGPTCLDV
jgi:DNA polymerase-3 subunit alpha